MSEDTTVTDAPATDTGSSEAPASTEQPAPAAQAPADNTTDNTTVTNDEGESAEISNKEAKWAESKGIDLNNPSKEDIAKLVKMQREAEKRITESTTQASELRKTVNQEVESEMASLPFDDQSARMQAELQAIKVNQAINDFYTENPDARQYDQAMAGLVKENPQLAQGGLEALYAVAKQRELDSRGKEALKQEGGQEALKQLAQTQKAASPTGNATSYAPSSAITREEVAQRTANGDVEWLTKHTKDIDALYK